MIRHSMGILPLPYKSTQYAVRKQQFDWKASDPDLHLNLLRYWLKESYAYYTDKLDLCSKQ